MDGSWTPWLYASGPFLAMAFGFGFFFLIVTLMDAITGNDSFG